jgi:membrane protease YdiL (CAAX protease family)
MKIRWPPSPLGLGTPFNLALCSSESRALMRRFWWLVPVLGVLTSFVMLAVDHVFFGGVSLQRVRELGSAPLALRLLIVVYSGVTEEVIYRLLLSTLVAWLAYMALARLGPPAKPVAQWIGILVAAVMFGLAHVGNLSHVPYPILRAVTVNGVAGIVLGWIYWWRGLELSILTHGAAIIVIYIIAPLFL